MLAMITSEQCLTLKILVLVLSSLDKRNTATSKKKKKKKNKKKKKKKKKKKSKKKNSIRCSYQIMTSLSFLQFATDIALRVKPAAIQVSG